MSLSIAERRSIGNRAAADRAFRAQLHAEPHEAVRQITGRALDKDCAVEVIEEGKEWRFVLVDPDTIELDLPDPVDARAAVENSAYGLLRDNPALRADMERDPIAFARAWLDIDLKDEAVVLQAEGPDALIVLVPNRDHREELDDQMMDLVAGGGNIGNNFKDVTEGPRT